MARARIPPESPRRFARALAVVAATLALATSPGRVAADVEAALALLKSGEATAARAEFRTLAESGDARAQEALATMAARGIGGQRDIALAMNWYCRLAHQAQGGRGVTRAQWMLAEYFRTGGALPELGYRSGRREDEDPVRAFFWYSLLAAQSRLFATVDDSAARLGRLGMNSVGRELYPSERAAVAAAVAAWRPSPPSADCLELPRKQ